MSNVMEFFTVLPEILYEERQIDRLRDRRMFCFANTC